MFQNRRTAVRALVLTGALAATTMTGAPAALATTTPPAGSTTNNATIDINGGEAKALAACVNYAKVMAKHGWVAQSNRCKNFASAEGGDVTLERVDVTIIQEGRRKGSTVNNATVSISGGDATALAACVNYLQGTASGTQTNHCANGAVAKGGDVVLERVDIIISQG